MTDTINQREEDSENRALIALSMVQGIGPGRIRQLISDIGTAQEVLQTSIEQLGKIKGIGAGVAWSISTFDQFDLVDEQFRWAERAGATLIPYWNARFPELLDKIYDPPAYLWVRGDEKVFAKKAIAIVGTRKPSTYGLKAAGYFAEELAQHGFTVVSGLAFGIDAAAHKSALEANGTSVAVLGSGIDRIYPAKHSELARELMLQGAVISELPLRSKPDAVNFPRRNRIISGLALGTLVVEAFEKGGALITARLAVEQNREVFAVPGSMFNNTSSGTHAIIKAGQAKLVCNVDDILEELGDYASSEYGISQITRENGQTKLAAQIANLGSIEKRLYDVLGEEPLQIDSICLMAGLDVSTALVYLLSLEFKGLIQQLAGKQFFRC